jgi:DNA-binding response OmpR family regulator
MIKKGNTPRVLLLEDDPTLNDIMCEFLEECGYDVVSTFDGEEAVDRGYEEAFDLFVFDVKVPAQSGHDVLRELRKAGRDTPAIFVTSLASVDDLSRGYDAGCDDYIKKPFELKELQLRIQTLLKRSYSATLDEKIVVSPLWSFELQSGKLFSQNQDVLLAKKEVKILKTLLSHRGQVVTHEQITKAAWGYDEEVSEESVRTHIKKLRKILGKELIENIRGQGYMLVSC